MRPLLALSLACAVTAHPALAHDNRPAPPPAFGDDREGRPAGDPGQRDFLEVRMMETTGEALEAIHQQISPRQGCEAERIYRIVEPAYKKAWLQRYEWKQEPRPERKRQRLANLNLFLVQTLRDVAAVGRAR